MQNSGEQSRKNPLGVTAITVHFCLVVCGVAALLSGLSAGDYKKIEHLGFTLHSWIGLLAAGVVLLRLVLGVVGPPWLRFGNWVPYTGKRLALVKEDLRELASLRLPHRPPHVGIAGLVETFGIVVFLLSALSGLVLFFTIEPGQKAHGMAHAVKEFHETGLSLILAFLTLHAGAVLLHALQGRHVWRRMFVLKEPVTSQGPVMK